MLVRPSQFKRRGKTDLFSKDSRSELFVRCQPIRQVKKGGKIVVANGQEQTIFETLGWRDGSEENWMWSGLN